MRVSAVTFAALRSFGSVWIAVLGLYLIAGLISPAMFSLAQVVNILQVASFLGVIAAGQTIVILTGGIDLSQAGLVTLTNILATGLIASLPDNVPFALAVTILVSLAIGFLNGLLVAWVGITPLIATLGSNAILFGAALVYTGGAPSGGTPPSFQYWGNGMLLGLPIPVLFWALVTILLLVLTRRTVWGRQLYATGANPRAAAMMGVPVSPVVISAYMLSALMAALGGLMLTAYIGSPSLGIGNQFMLTSVAAVVVGGAALSGGAGSVLATVGGAIFITELSSLTNIMRVSTGTQFVVQGVLILVSVVAYRALSGVRSGSPT
ncbi:ABC transporter permease [Mesorhizobium sp. BAC0120]|uniref:ABC transporter permease n=1 Tax=Mesorhizobium sp. BAC0120 TaxID=3090670 RepID=UPI00298CBCC0|nr:ABC transporter permease [Mesorhizobium sp. BAC0120]MDW6024201.1 ABC transporter permease [Mesorhizobium sp. BAC0120]